MTKLEESERLIRKDGARSRWLAPGQMKAIAEELDRLRAEIAALKGEDACELERWRQVGEELKLHVHELGDTGDPARALYAARCVVDALTTAKDKLSEFKGDTSCDVGCGAPGENCCGDADRCPHASAVVRDLADCLREHFPGETSDVATVVKRLLSSLKGEAERTVFVPAVEHDGGAKNALWRFENGCTWPTAEAANVYGKGSWEVRISARKVER